MEIILDTFFYIMYLKPNSVFENMLNLYLEAMGGIRMYWERTTGSDHPSYLLSALIINIAKEARSSSPLHRAASH